MGMSNPFQSQQQPQQQSQQQPNTGMGMSNAFQGQGQGQQQQPQQQSQQGEDYGDKAFDMLSKKAGHPMDRNTGEKITDGARNLFEKVTG